MTASGDKALFLDRDGTINIDHGYVHRVEDFDWVPEIFESCALARALGFRLIVVTNQAGIGRGYYDEAQYQRLTTWMRERFQEAGVPLDAVYHCPHHPEHGIGAYRQASPWRKPEPGMLLQAAEDFALNLGQSIIIGDSLTDLQAGHRAGLAAQVWLGGPADTEKEPPPNTVCVPDLAAFQEWLRQAPY